MASPKKSESVSTRTASNAPNCAKAFPCESCGADMEFNIGTQSLKCGHCGFVKTIDVDPDAVIAEQDFGAMLGRIKDRRAAPGSEAAGFREVTCNACGATVRFAGTLTSSECAYCGVAVQVDNVHDAVDRIPVDAMLPFKVPRDAAHASLQAWVQSRWFAPNEFRRRGADGQFIGVYLPYWTYDAMTCTHYRGERGEHYWVTVGSGKNRRRARRTRWYPASGKFQRFFDDVLVVAGRGLPTKRLDALDPWPLGECGPFHSQMLAGFLAKTYDVPLEEGFATARTQIEEALRTEIAQRIGGDEQRIHAVDTRYDAITYKHLLLPIWMLSYRFKAKSYQVVINAVTGEVQGDRPYSWIKIGLAALAATAAIAVILFLTRAS